MVGKIYIPSVVAAAAASVRESEVQCLCHPCQRHLIWRTPPPDGRTDGRKEGGRDAKCTTTAVAATRPPPERGIKSCDRTDGHGMGQPRS